jgi:hypothetical protein
MAERSSSPDWIDRSTSGGEGDVVSTAPVSAEKAAPVKENKDKQSEEVATEILKSIFGEVGELIDDYTCAVESNILLHGRMYVTPKFVCFYSNLFGLEKKIRIPYQHITTITKEMTGTGFNPLSQVYIVCVYSECNSTYIVSV